MSTSGLRTEVIPATGVIVIGELANFFMLVQTASGVTCIFQHNGTRDEVSNVEAGYVRGRVNAWERATITGTAGSTVRFFIGDEDIKEDFTDYRRTVGVFQQQQPATVADTADVNVGGSAAAIQLVPANASRRRVTVKLNDGAGVSIRVGAQATVAAARGVQLNAGQAQTFEVTGAIWAMREGAGTAVVSINEEVF